MSMSSTALALQTGLTAVFCCRVITRRPGVLAMLCIFFIVCICREQHLNDITLWI